MVKLQTIATSAVAKINNIEILITSNGDEKFVPIKPICRILGIDYAGQQKKILADEILGSTKVLSTSVGQDKKERPMFTIPFKYVFGWLFTINPKNVNEKARDKIIKYKLECYDALYDHFVGAKKFLELKENATERLVDQLKADRKNFRSKKDKLKETQNQLESLSKMTYQEYLENNRQLLIDFSEIEEGGES